jgi:hypothetical protein
MKTLTKILVKNYFSNHWDITVQQLTKEFRLDNEGVGLLQKYLDELVNEGWVKKSAYKNSFEYDPGENYKKWEDASPPEAKVVTDYLNKKK